MGLESLRGAGSPQVRIAAGMGMVETGVTEAVVTEEETDMALKLAMVGGTVMEAKVAL